MKYIDGFLIPVPKKKLDEYKKLARKAGFGLWGRRG